MQKHYVKFLQSVVALPILAASLATPMVGVTGSPTAAVISPDTNRPLSITTAVNQQKSRDEKAQKIDAYLAKYNLPLAGHGQKLVTAAEENDLPPYILASIAFNESTGCKFMIKGTNNCFGWGSGKIRFTSIDDSIDTVARAISGNNENLAHYYDGKDIKEILEIYNGRANPQYVRKVLMVMSQMEKQSLPLAKAKSAPDA